MTDASEAVVRMESDRSLDTYFGVGSTSLLETAVLDEHEAMRLLIAVTGASRTALIGGMLINDAWSGQFFELVARRKAGEPLQYLEGTVQFGPIDLLVDQRVLIPRPETEQLWERAMQLLPSEPSTVVDMGTGSGCLALAMRHDRPDVAVVATDISSEALEVARKNAARLHLDVRFRHGDRLAALDPSLAGTVTMIVTNPPYVSEDEWATLAGEIRYFEPKTALVLGDGLDMYRYLATEAAEWLTRDGLLIAEIGDRQGDRVMRLFRSEGWEAAVERDWTGRDRFLIARMVG